MSVKRTGKVALCGVMAALATVLMLLAYFPYLTFAVPAVAGLLFVILSIETSPKWAFTAYIAASVLVALMAEQEAKLMFIAFFGYYPILKGIIESLRKPVLEYVIKFALFNVVMVAAYVLMIFVFGMPLDQMGSFGKWTAVVLLVMGNAAFLLYDYTITQLVGLYMRSFHARMKKLIH